MTTNNAYKRGLYSSLIRIAANLIMLGAVCLGMYQAGQHPEASFLVFCQWFFAVTIPTWTGAFMLLRRLRRRFPLEWDQATYVKLPRLGAKRVVWQVAAERHAA
ncbi:MAG: hypothetical protein ACI33N_04075 [Desulfovibrionaceae bacterium]|nr:hypothetical protein [Desulfovibrionaceae bacterium]